MRTLSYCEEIFFCCCFVVNSFYAVIFICSAFLPVLCSTSDHSWQLPLPTDWEGGTGLTNQNPSLAFQYPLNTLSTLIDMAF
jgi:hypothetical protein